MLNPYSQSPAATRKPVIAFSISSDARATKPLCKLLADAGAEPYVINNHDERLQHGTLEEIVAQDLANIDALIVGGNRQDINPAKYGCKDVHPKTIAEEDTARCRYEELAIQMALDMGMPVLGICGGMQRLNVMGGGTLHQHVPDVVHSERHVQTEDPSCPTQNIRIFSGTHLASITGRTKSLYQPAYNEEQYEVPENSLHHQAVKKLRPDFRVSALSEDRIIEAIEPKPGSKYANQFVIGVQWHPEASASDIGQKLTAAITEAAISYSLKKPRDTVPQRVWTTATSRIDKSTPATDKGGVSF